MMKRVLRILIIIVILFCLFFLFFYAGCRYSIRTSSISKTTSSPYVIGGSKYSSNEFFTDNGTKHPTEALNPVIGRFDGPSGEETYYNLDMQYVVYLMNELGYDYEYWIREDGVKMFGDYVMCAANLDVRPKGTLVETSLGTAIVCDTGEFALENPDHIDIAVNW